MSVNSTPTPKALALALTDNIRISFEIDGWTIDEIDFSDAPELILRGGKGDRCIEFAVVVRDVEVE